MSTPAGAEAVAPPPPVDPGAIPCPRCGTTVVRAQDWCLACGAPARTRLAPAPNWKLPVVAVGTLLALALVALVVAFAALTDNPSQPTGTTSTTATTPPPTTATPAPAPAPGTTTQVDPSTPPAP